MKVGIGYIHIGERGIVFFFHHRFPDWFQLRKKAAFFFGVAILGSSLNPGASVNILANAFMNSAVFVDEIVIVFIIGIKML